MFNEWSKDILSDLTKSLVKEGYNPNEILDKLPEIIPRAIEDLAIGTLDHWKQTGEMISKEMNEYGVGFKERLFQSWEIPFNNTEKFVWFCHEMGNKFNEEFRPRAHRENNLVYEVISRQHARSCCIAFEMFELMKAGFANGAMCRWRSLHENAVLTSFIREYRQKAAELYLDHDAIQVSRTLTDYMAHAEPLGFTKIEKDFSQNIEKAKRVLIDSYGKEFLYDYGWASKATGEKVFGLKGLEKIVELEHYRPFYNMASQMIHSGVRSIFVSLGIDSMEMLLSGPSDMGMADPGQLMVMSLNIISSNLLAVYPTYLGLLLSKVLNTWVLEIQNQYKSAHNKYEKK